MILYILFLTIICAVVRNSLENDLFKSLPLSIAVTAVSIFPFAIFGFSAYILYGLIVGALIALFWIVYLKSSYIPVMRTATVNALYISAVLTLAYFVCEGKAVTAHDDFNHWALISKVFYYKGGLDLGPGSSYGYHDYLPGAAILNYPLLEFSRGFDESLLFIASISTQIFIILGLLSTLIKSNKTFNVGLLCVLTTIIALSLQIDHQTVISPLDILMPDWMLSLLFAFNILYALDSVNNQSLFRLVVNLTFLCVLMLLLKPVGIYLSFVTVCMLVVAIYYSNEFRNRKLRSIAIAFIPFIIAFAVSKSWSWLVFYTASNASNIVVGANASLSMLLVGLYENDVYLFSVFENFYHGISSNNITLMFGGVSLLNFMVYVYSLSFVAAFAYKLKTKSSKFVILTLVLLCLNLLYIAIHVGVYTYAMSKGEANGLSSLFRYELYFVVAALFYLAYIATCLNKINIAFCSAIIILLAIYTHDSKLYPVHNLSDEGTDVSEKVFSANISKFFNTLPNREGKVCLFEGVNGSSYGYSLMLRYDAAPIDVERIVLYHYHPDKYDSIDDAYYKNKLIQCKYVVLVRPDSRNLYGYGLFPSNVRHGQVLMRDNSASSFVPVKNLVD